MNQSRRDDLETLGYSILDMMTNPGEIDFLNVDRSAMGISIPPNIHIDQINAK